MVLISDDHVLAIYSPAFERHLVDDWAAERTKIGLITPCTGHVVLNKNIRMLFSTQPAALVLCWNRWQAKWFLPVLRDTRCEVLYGAAPAVLVPVSQLRGPGADRSPLDPFGEGPDCPLLLERGGVCVFKGTLFGEGNQHQTHSSGSMSL